MRVALLLVLLVPSGLLAQNPGVWRVREGDVIHEIPGRYDWETVQKVLESQRMSGVFRAEQSDVRSFRGIVLSVGPDGSTGLVTATTRGEVVPVLVVYHDGRNALRWSELAVKKLTTTDRVTPAERYIRGVPESGTQDNVRKLGSGGR